MPQLPRLTEAQSALLLPHLLKLALKGLGLSPRDVDRFDGHFGPILRDFNRSKPLRAFRPRPA